MEIKNALDSLTREQMMVINVLRTVESIHKSSEF